MEECARVRIELCPNHSGILELSVRVRRFATRFSVRNVQVAEFETDQGVGGGVLGDVAPLTPHDDERRDQACRHPHFRKPISYRTT